MTMARKTLLICSGLTSVLILRWLAHSIIKRQKKAKNEQKKLKAQSKRAEQLNNLKAELKQFSFEKSEEILNLTVPELLEKLIKGELTSLQVVSTYQKAALASHDQTNCLVEIINESKELCNSPIQQGQLLYGIPVCLKEDIGLKGYTTCFGCAKWLEQPLIEDSVIVKVLKHHGAIPFVRTNLCQMTLTYESSNPIYGETLNAVQNDRSPGGSSSGNGALIGSGGSPIGIGSDMGGSLRLPAHFNGIVALKPSVGRVSSKGCKPLFPGREINPPAYGPQGKDVQSVVSLMKALASNIMYELDETIPPLPFNNDLYESKKNFRIGYFDFNGVFPAVPAVKRAVEHTKNILSNKGYEMVNCSSWHEQIQFQVGVELITDHTLIDGCKEMMAALDNEELDASFQQFIGFLRMPKFIQRLIAHMVSLSDQSTGRILAKMINRDASVTKLFEHGRIKQEYKEKIRSLWESENLDAIICPPCGVYAPPPKKYMNAVGPATTYASAWNITNYVAGVVPVTTVNEKDEKDLDQYLESNKSNPLAKLTCEGSRGGVGLPVGIQVITPPFREETCLNIMRQIEKGVKY
ncbi:DgyrCDS7859 [Dimorphilus gyrociliatus]|uniref:fatty acid amide hydrolase n=1 Tax=Dimorphilus gyrociliatus TaxID=2664684 RepID=A0A7I8VTE5_9ANNE|nr:DgyrCDS7859 [Dimorphilus gyrociliatus]